METLTVGGWRIAKASVIGGAHRLAARDGQDGSAVRSSPERVIAVVTDGCGSSPLSEVGAKLGAGLWVEALSRELVDGLSLDCLLRARGRVVDSLGRLLADLGGDPADAVRDFFLFTTLAAVIDRERACVFAIGDGVIGINDEYVVLDSGAGNAPAYVGYALCPQTAALADFSTVALRPARDTHSIVLATDGAIPLVGVELTSMLAGDDIYRNRDGLRRQLEPLARGDCDIDWQRQRTSRRAARLGDDTTIVSIRRGVDA